ncbi:hypothetical protein E1297_02380 [Roseibium sp. RKSG952]|nr:hypothetical protein [Roseibium sp. RKSG952]
MSTTEIDIDKPQLRRAWSLIDEAFRRHGLCVRRESDFEKADRLSKENGLVGFEANFIVGLHTFTNCQAFWLGLFDRQGQCVGRVGARLDQMKPPMTLADFWKRHVFRCYPSAEGGGVKMASDQPRFGNNISGNVVYLGGAEIHEDWQGKKLGGLLVQMAQIEALDEWQADFVYGWMESWKFKDGFWRDCGFTHAYPRGLRWDGAGPVSIDENLIVAGNSAADILDLIDHIVHSRTPA